MASLLRRLNPVRRAQPDVARSWREDVFWVIDVESTGLNLRRDKIIAYGAVPIRRGRIQMAETTYGLVGITDDVPEASTCIHYIRTQDLAAAPPLEDVVRQLDSMIGDTPIIAHCAVIERTLLARAYRTAGLELRNPFVDTAPLATAALDEEVEGGYISLEYAATALGVPVHAPHHALGDAITTANVFLAVASRIERDSAPNPVSTAALTEASTPPTPQRRTFEWPYPRPL
ncbi:3'-5' exonuclease [Mycolicibacterium sp. 120266]|uniref:3'-5' exonuclease n=1 Tax=Mycolicibacterium sp. 120266 TaxID=3090601 RepID=UPI00299D01C4|nr:3'-5' exonuclease [Mycolicibacterium sp. 120266]MDX1876153.1 3'-5' exonuclease [Mycolicibacterium sp. 120266]